MILLNLSVKIPNFIFFQKKGFGGTNQTHANDVPDQNEEKPSKKIAQSPQMQIFKFMQKGRRYFARDSTIFCQSFVTKTFVKIEE